MSSEANLRNCLKTSESTREDKDPEALCMTQSSILYLLQEATKLVTPPKLPSLDTPFHHNTNEIISYSSTSLKHGQEVGPDKTQPSFRGAFSMLSSSPWEVMTLINLQCERLLHSDGTYGQEEDSETHKIKTDTKPEDGEFTREWSSFTSAVSTSVLYSGVNADDVMEQIMESDVCCSVPHILDPAGQMSIQSSSENCESITIQAGEDLAELISKTTEGMSEDGTDNYFLVQTSVLPLDLTKKEEICQPTIKNREGVNEPKSVTFISKAQQSPEISSVDFTSSLVAEKYEDSCFSFNVGGNADCESALVLKTPASRTDLNNNLEDETLHEADKTRTVLSPQPRSGNRRRTPRKQAHPARSADLQDPGLQGVTFSMHTELDHSTDQCRLLITSNLRQAPCI